MAKGQRNGDINGTGFGGGSTHGYGGGCGVDYYGCGWGHGVPTSSRGTGDGSGLADGNFVYENGTGYLWQGSEDRILVYDRALGQDFSYEDRDS